MLTKRIAFMPLVTYPDPLPDEAVSAAFRFAGALGCDIEPVAFAAEIPKVRSPFGGLLLNVPEMIRTAETTSLARCHHMQGLVPDAGGPGPAVRFTILHADPGATGANAAVAARYHDLTVMPWAKDVIASQELATALVFGSGRPTILVPAFARSAAISQIALAWDGSGVAARALGDVLPLLADGARITVLTVQDEKPHMEHGLAERLVKTLHRRGIDAATRIVMLEGRQIAVALQDAANASGAGLLAMGGFGHSRLREFVLGGATQGVFTDLRLPVLLSH